MTSEAWSALAAEAELLAAELRDLRAAPIGGRDARRRDIPARLARLRAILGSPEVVDGAETAAIGRRVTIGEPDGTSTTYALVVPGDGDPAFGWLAVDAPLGRAVLGARPGDEVVVSAPSGVRRVRIVDVG